MNAAFESVNENLAANNLSILKPNELTVGKTYMLSDCRYFYNDQYKKGQIMAVLDKEVKFFFPPRYCRAILSFLNLPDDKIAVDLPSLDGVKMKVDSMTTFYGQESPVLSIIDD
jgi:hypothetical protein